MGARETETTSSDVGPSADASADAADAREGAVDAREGAEAGREDARDAGEDAGDGEEACGFCKYMKGGSCREAFVAWEACVDAAKERGEDFVDACFETTSALRDCMLLDPEYYGPMTGGEENEGEVEGAEKVDVEGGDAAKESAA